MFSVYSQFFTECVQDYVAQRPLSLIDIVRLFPTRSMDPRFPRHPPKGLVLENILEKPLELGIFVVSHFTFIIYAGN